MVKIHIYFMKKLAIILAMLSILLLSVSCVSSIYAYDDNGDFDVSVVINNGSVHYYSDGRIMYYLYNGWYYYPYYRNNTVYYYRYSSPIRRHFSPTYRFSPNRNDRPFYRRYRYEKIVPNNRFYRSNRNNNRFLNRR